MLKRCCKNKANGNSKSAALGASFLPRLTLLNAMLQYCSDSGGIFTPAERFLINQERAELLRQRNRYPPELQDKMQATTARIIADNWQYKEILSAYG